MSKLNESNQVEEERIQTWKEKIGLSEVNRRSRVYLDIQSVCHELAMSNPEDKEAMRLLELAEDLREDINSWTWGLSNE